MSLRLEKPIRKPTVETLSQVNYSMEHVHVHIIYNQARQMETSFRGQAYTVTYHYFVIFAAVEQWKNVV